MKQVMAGISKEGVPFIRWCEGWSLEHEHHEDENVRWTRFTVPLGNRLAEHITRLVGAITTWSVYRQAGNNEKAIEHYHNALKRDPKFASALSALAELEKLEKE